MYNYQYVEESVKFEKDNNPEVSQEDVFERLFNEVLDEILEELWGEVQN